jgi:type II secretion system protein N
VTLAFALAALALHAALLALWLRQSPAALRDRAERELGLRLGRALRVARAEARLAAGLPALALGDLAIELPPSPLQFESLDLRPEWSTAWLTGRPALRASLRGESGSADLSIGVREPGSLVGALGDFDLRLLALAAPELHVTGRGSAQLDLAELGSKPRGRVELDAGQGELTLPGLSLVLPFDRLALSAELGGERGLLALRDGELLGPDLRARFTGGIGAGDRFESAPLDLRIELEVGASLRPLAEAAGIALSEQRRAVLSVRGTLARPELR